VSGFESIHADAVAQEGVSISLCNVVPSEGSFGVIVVELGEGEDVVSNEDSEVIGSGFVVGVWLACGVFEVSFFHTDGLSVSVHFLSEEVFISGAVFGNDDSGVIA